IALALTPLVREAAARLGLFDAVSARKVHRGAIPRLGGIAVYLAFVGPFAAGLVYQGPWTDRFDFDLRAPAFLGGATLMFAIGLLDDLFTLDARIKLAGQAVAALVTVSGGTYFAKIALPLASEVTLGWIGVPATVFWFVLVINAFNLIDGLDGLAAGITLFASCILLVMSVVSGSYLVAMGFAALAGASLGFLRYNWNPASIFLGDGGSYFLGYCLAGLSLLAARKSEATVAILIPIIALGVPMIDALWAPLRRFILGQRLFQPDRDHIHHRLLKLGYTPRRAVLLLYAMTIAMGTVALLLVHARDDRGAAMLLAVGIGASVFIRKLGYLEFIRSRQLVDWFGSVTDALGIPQARRSFLEHQAAIAVSHTPGEMWQGICAAATFLDLDYCELVLKAGPENAPGKRNALEELVFRYESKKRAPGAPVTAGSNEALHLSLPFLQSGVGMGRLVVHRSYPDRVAHPFLVRRIDQLHGTVRDTLARLQQDDVGGAGAAGTGGAPPLARAS